MPKQVPTNPPKRSDYLHHPGPWWGDNDTVRCDPDENDGGTFICQMDSSRSCGETEANRDLIAEAPHLAKYLACLSEMLERYVDTSQWDIADKFMLDKAVETLRYVGYKDADIEQAYDAEYNAQRQRVEA